TAQGPARDGARTFVAGKTPPHTASEGHAYGGRQALQAERRAAFRRPRRCRPRPVGAHARTRPGCYANGEAASPDPAARRLAPLERVVARLPPGPQAL